MVCELTISVDPREGAARVVIAGELDASSANSVLKQLLAVLRSARTHVVVDLSQTCVLDTGGVGILAAAHLQAIAWGAELRLTGVPANLRSKIAAEWTIDATGSGVPERRLGDDLRPVARPAGLRPHPVRGRAP